MARLSRTLYVVALIAFLADSDFAIGGAAGKGRENGHGARAAEQMSNKGGSNNNAQWSADPVRGWVRADERKRTSEKTASSNARKQNDKRTGKDKGKKS